MDIGSLAGCLQLLLRGVQFGIQQVGADGIVEQIGFLRHHADLFCKGFQGHIPQVNAIDPDAPELGS